MSVLKIDNLDLIYIADKTPLLKNINLEINEGDVVLLAGKNGIGKTTFINALTNNFGSDGTRYACFSGQFEIAGASPDEKLFERVIYVPQNDYISFPFVNVYRALLASCPVSRKDSKVYVKNWIEKYDPFSSGDKALLKKRVGNLSGGEKKYVSIIQSLLRCDESSVRLIIMDEPINSLDSSHVRLLSNLLLKIKYNNPRIGFLIVSHCHAFPYVSTLYEIKDNKLNPGSYCCGTCFGDVDDKGFYIN